MIESRCGILCGTCPYNAKNGGLEGSTCTGCTNMEKPVWADSCPVKSCCEGKSLLHCGLCGDFPCKVLVDFANDKEHGDEGRRIEQCRAWAQDHEGGQSGCCGGTTCCGPKDGGGANDGCGLPYEAVSLPAKTFAGYAVRLKNNSPELQAEIGALWQRFYSGGSAAIAGKKNAHVYGLYANYEGNHEGAYDAAVCCEVSAGTKQPADITTYNLPAGKYAKFVVSGQLPQVVGEFWQKLWAMDLPRSYTGDFEEYQDGCTMERGEIHIYIALAS